MDDDRPQTTTIPSSEPTTVPPTPQPDKPTTPRSSPSNLEKLRLILRYHITKLTRSTDRNILRLSTLLSTPTGIDALLCTATYTFTLIHALLSRVLERRLADIARDIADKADGILLPGETLIASLPAPTSTKVIAQIVGSSKALAAVISDYRIFVRLWGIVGVYTWARGTYLSPLSKDAEMKERLLRGLTWAAIASSVAFQILENGAYLSSKGALTTASWTGDVGKARENKWWIWSSRFWAVYVGIELARLAITRYYRDDTLLPSANDGEKEDKIQREEQAKARKLDNWLWWKDLASNVAYAPMTLHWSKESGLLSDWGVGACGIVAGGALLVDAWRETR